MRSELYISDFMAIINIGVSLAIFVLFMLYRGRLFEQNKIEQIGLNLMAICAFVIVCKTVYNLASAQVQFDVFGLLFRAGYLLYMIGCIYTTHTVGVSVAATSPRVVRVYDEERKPTGAVAGHC